VGTTEEGSKELQDLMEGKAFAYPKPRSLIEGLLSQATRPGDTVLDFFAGSGTTGHAVLSLNAQDGGERRFILCSSTEATTSEPHKNLCRDVCAERMRRVIQNEGYSASFAYLQLDKIEAADMDFEATPQHAALLTALRETGGVPAEPPNAALQVVAKGSDWLTVFCAKATPKAMNELATLPARHGVARLAVYCPRPKAMAELLQERGIEAVTYSITDALLKGQISSLRNPTPHTPSPQHHGRGPGMNTPTSDTPTVPADSTAMPMASIAMPAQSAAVQPEAFQNELILGMTRTLLREPSPPCLLRAPTGAGKTYIMSQVLERVSAERGVVWFWFVPFVNLVQQTEDGLRGNAPSLAPCFLSTGRNQEAHNGMVLLSTAQAVARAQSRQGGYDVDGDDEVRTLAAFVARARAQGLQVGLVVDEAHIGLKKSTEFGQFAKWLKPDYLIMATATPKDDLLNAFLKDADYSAQVNFSVSRDQVVEARLNKKYIEAVVYTLGESMSQVADLTRTVLYQSWQRNRLIERQLAKARVNLQPLLLVQVANGDKTVEEAEDILIRHCQVPPDAIGKHSSDEPDPVMMAAIASNSSKRVLIFKQSAGTGFDAPRAFVLASTKVVNDTDFAMQFVGRIIRVPRPVRDAFAKPQEIPADLNTAFVYLGNAQAQSGFEAAVKANAAVKDQLEGQTEKLLVRQTLSGAVSYGNRPVAQAPVAFDMPVPARPAAPSETSPATGAKHFVGMTHITDQVDWLTVDGCADIWQSTNAPLDDVKAAPQGTNSPNRQPQTVNTRDELVEALGQRGLRAYQRNPALPGLTQRLKTEVKPVLEDMSEISRTAAIRLEISEELKKVAVRAAFNRIKEKEQHTELTDGSFYTVEIQVFTDRNALARQARAALKTLPQAEDEDYRIVVATLASRLDPAILEFAEDFSQDRRPDANELKRLARDAAHWVIIKQAQPLKELMFSEIAQQARLIDAAPLPDHMVFPEGLRLTPSTKNIYGVIPPSRDVAERIPQTLVVDDRAWMADKTFELNDGMVVQGKFDDTWFGNPLEESLSRALDRAEFVVWWHRNPRNKPYAVRVVRAEHDNYFYPDFVVCVRHSPSDEPIARLLETKDDTKDASRKSKHWPKQYGKVLFLTPYGDRLKWVHEDGSIGDDVDLDNMQTVLDKLASTRPLMQ
jgi:type III restriction enzyme